MAQHPERKRMNQKQQQQEKQSCTTDLEVRPASNHYEVWSTRSIIHQSNSSGAPDILFTNLVLILCCLNVFKRIPVFLQIRLIH